MSSLHLTFLFCGLNLLFSEGALKHTSFKPKTVSSNTTTNPVTGKEPAATNIIYQSKDFGQTWQDISDGLPENARPENFFAGEAELYLQLNGVMYSSKSNLQAPVWEIEKGFELQDASIAFNHSAVIAHNYEGEIYQKTSQANWVPTYENFRKHSMRTVFETSNNTVFLGYDGGLYKSTDRGKTWKHVQDEGWVIHMVEGEGVLLATGQKGIMRSTDNGDHWQWVIREGGVGFAIEKIDGGFAAISCNTTTVTRRIHISMDSGKTWRAIDDGLRPSLFISSIKQVGKYLICGHPDGIFRSGDMGKTWNMVHPGVDSSLIRFRTIPNPDPFDDQKNVFKIYVSGNVAYAVASNAGC